MINYNDIEKYTDYKLEYLCEQSIYNRYWNDSKLKEIEFLLINNKQEDDENRDYKLICSLYYLNDIDVKCFGLEDRKSLDIFKYEIFVIIYNEIQDKKKLEYLIKHSQEIDAPLLHFISSNFYILRFLLKANVDVNSLNGIGQTILFDYALCDESFYIHDDTIEFLKIVFDYKINPFIIDIYGKTVKDYLNEKHIKFIEIIETIDRYNIHKEGNFIFYGRYITTETPEQERLSLKNQLIKNDKYKIEMFKTAILMLSNYEEQYLTLSFQSLKVIEENNLLC